VDALYAEIEPREDAIRTEYRGKIREVLTPEQQAEWDKIKGEYRQKWNGKEPSKKK
jgi:Spy/CpxP family protein refolding chaperone